MGFACHHEVTDRSENDGLWWVHVIVGDQPQHFCGVRSCSVEERTDKACRRRRDRTDSRDLPGGHHLSVPFLAAAMRHECANALAIGRFVTPLTHCSPGCAPQ
jgi:hypothetical protein